MKKIVYLSVLSFLAASCHEEVVLPVGDNEPVGVMNAQLNTLEPVHTVFLSVSQKSRVRAMPGAQVRIFVNGMQAAVAEEIPAAYEGEWETAYTFESVFKPEDEIRIEARSGEMTLSSTVTVPEAVTISSLDTSTVRMSYMGDASTYLQLKTEFEDLPGTSFYRVDGRMVDEFTYLDEEGNPVPGYSGTSESSLWVETGFDPVISEGAGKTGGADLGALLAAENSYHCFSDTPFSGREGTIRPLVYHDSFRLPEGFHYGIYVPDWMGDEIDWEKLRSMKRKVSRRVTLQLRSLDFPEYHYFKSLEILETFGTDMSFLVEPTTLPTNVEGGLGFVGVETVSEIPFYTCTREYPPMDDVIYY